MENEFKDTVILEVPDDVYVSISGNRYYPKKSARASKKMTLLDAEAKGYTPSSVYKKFVENLYKQQIKEKQHELDTEIK